MQYIGGFGCISFDIVVSCEEQHRHSEKAGVVVRNGTLVTVLRYKECPYFYPGLCRTARRGSPATTLFGHSTKASSASPLQSRQARAAGLGIYVGYGCYSVALGIGHPAMLLSHADWLVEYWSGCLMSPASICCEAWPVEFRNGCLIFVACASVDAGCAVALRIVRPPPVHSRSRSQWPVCRSHRLALLL